MKNIANILIFTGLILLLNSSSCKKTESLIYKSEFEIINSTDTGVTIKSWLNNRQVKSINISKHSSYQTIESLEQPLTAAQFFNSDSLEINFNDNKKLIYSWYRPSPTTNNILTTGWLVEKKGERYTKRTYEITQEHRDSAK